jgi:hypothetical protein
MEADVNDLEWRVEQQRLRIAEAIPGYLGYRERERRRDADRQLRHELARQYAGQRGRLTDIQRRASGKPLLEYLDDIERVNLKLQRFIDRLRTASYGYAGWFDVAPVREAELQQLYTFDHALTAGVERMESAVAELDAAVDAGEGIDEAVESLSSTVDGLNRRFDQRRDLLAEGKKVPPNELREALEVPAEPNPAFQVLADLKIDDALTYEGADYLVLAKVTYDMNGQMAYAYQLEDTDRARWLRVHPAREAVALYEVIELDVGAEPSAQLDVDGKMFHQVESGQAKAYIIGPGGRREGVVDYRMYATESTSAAGEQLWIEEWGDTVRAHRGWSVDVDQVQVWPRR